MSGFVEAQDRRRGIQQAEAPPKYVDSAFGLSAAPGHGGLSEACSDGARSRKHVQKRQGHVPSRAFSRSGAPFPPITERYLPRKLSAVS